MSDDLFEWEGTPAGQEPAPPAPARRELDASRGCGAVAVAAAVAAALAVVADERQLDAVARVPNTIARRRQRDVRRRAGFRFSLTMAASVGRPVGLGGGERVGDRASRQQELSMTMSAGRPEHPGHRGAAVASTSRSTAPGTRSTATSTSRRSATGGGLARAAATRRSCLQFLGADRYGDRRSAQSRSAALRRRTTTPSTELASLRRHRARERAPGGLDAAIAALEQEPASRPCRSTSGSTRSTACARSCSR